MTFIVDVVMLQMLADPIPYKNPGPKDHGDHVFAILRRWRGSMDLQVVENSFAVSRYILGYVIKDDTARDAAATLQNVFAADGGVCISAQHRHFMLGMPTVQMSREYTYVAFVPSAASPPHVRKVDRWTYVS